MNSKTEKDNICCAKKKLGRPRSIFYLDKNAQPKKQTHPLPKKPVGVKGHLYFVGFEQDLTKHSQNVFAGNIVVRTPNHPRHGVVCFKDYYGFDINYKEPDWFLKICQFYDRAIYDIMLQDPEAEFMFYDPYCKQFNMLDKHKDVCKIPPEIVRICTNKYEARKVFKDCVNVLESKTLIKYEIVPQLLDRAFGKKFEKWVVQEPFAYGGMRTFVLDRDPERYSRVRLKIKNHFEYEVCPFVEGIVVNVHFAISGNNFVVFDGLVEKQKMDIRIKNVGWSFEDFDNLLDETKTKIFDETKKLIQKLIKYEYNGIGGAKFVVDKNEKIWFLELNPRFQESSEGLDKRLQNQGFPSLFKIVWMCDNDKASFLEISRQISH